MSGNQANLAKKAYEIAYAVFRIMPKVSEGTIAGKMAAEATDILTNSVSEKYKEAIKSLEVLNYLIKFSVELNFVSFMNGEVLIREIGNLQASIAESISAGEKDIDIAGIFTADDIEIKNNENPAKQEPPEKSGNIIKSGMRQIAILDRIRQSGNCRLRDIQEILPDTSERTIRYDLEDLMERNIIERVGNGGPSVFYRIRQMV